MKWFGQIANWFWGTGKSMGSMGVGLRAALSGGAPGGWASDHREETAHNTGFNYIAIHAIASQVAGATVTVFADGDQQFRRQSRRKALAIRVGSFSQWKSIYGADDRETDPLPTSHPLVRLLKRPNPQESGANFRYRQAQQIRLTGTCLVWNVPSVSGLTCERYVIPTAMASPVAPTSDLPRGGWRINPVASRYTPIVDGGYIDCPSWYRILGQIVDSRQVQVIRIPHAWYLDDGQSPLSAGAKWVDAGEAVDEARYHQLKNGIDPSIVWNLPPDVSPDQDEMDRFQAKISSKYGGPGNVGRVMVAQSGTSITPLSTSPKEMCFSEGFQDLKSAVLALHQTPPVAVGLQEPGAYAAYNASMKAWRHAAIQPLCDLLAESETEYLAPQFGRGLTVEIESDTVDDSDLIERQLQNDLSAKVRTKNEWRSVRGMPPLPGSQGDELVGNDAGGSNGDKNGPDVDPDPTLNQTGHPDFKAQSEWIARILSRLYRKSLRTGHPWQFAAKTYDPNLHPHDELGRFAFTGSHASRNLVGTILSGGYAAATPDEVEHHLSKISPLGLQKLHDQNNIVPVPSTREHLERSVLARQGRFPLSEAKPFPTRTRSRKTAVHVQKPDLVNQRLPNDPNGKTRPPLTSKQWGQLVGAQPGATVHVFPSAINQIMIITDHPNYYSRCILRSDSMELDYIVVAPDRQKRGIGFRVLSQQVKTAKDLGYKTINAGAAGNGLKITISEHDWEAQGMKDPNGYYTWALLGFDGKISSLMKTRMRSKEKELKAVAADFQKKFPNVNNVSELMLTKRGRSWWKNFGGYFEGKFDLSDGSVSRRVLTKYTREKQKDSRRKSVTILTHHEKRSDHDFSCESTEAYGNPDAVRGSWSQVKARGTNGLCESPDPLSSEDEVILGRVWDEVAGAMGSQANDEERPNDMKIEETSSKVN